MRDPTDWHNLDGNNLASGYFFHLVMPLATPRTLKGVSAKQKPTFKKPSKPLEITLVVPYKEYDRWIDFKAAEDEVDTI